MFSQRSHISLLHTPSAMDGAARRYNVMRLTGTADAEIWDLAKLKQEVPHLNFGPDARFPIVGAAVQTRAGTARHDAVAWGYARAADALGVDIIQNCEVTATNRSNGAITSLTTSRGDISADKVGFAVAGNTSRLWQMAGFNTLPIESHKLQAFVSEPLKPLLDQVVVFGVGGAHFYISQSDKGGMALQSVPSLYCPALAECVYCATGQG